MLAAVKTGALTKFHLTPSSLGLATEDGASNNKTAAKIMGMPFMVCYPHDLQRCLLFAAGGASPGSSHDPMIRFLALNWMPALPMCLGCPVNR